VTAYATLADLTALAGAEELMQLASAPTGALDQARVANALDLAGDQIDAYLRPRYALPLSTVPRVLVRVATAIARYDLHLGGQRQPTDQVRRDRDDAMALLRDIQAGKADLGLGPTGAEPAEDGGGAVLRIPGARGFDEDRLDEFRGLVR
jgi:phage gp36-like protein